MWADTLFLLRRTDLPILGDDFGVLAGRETAAGPAWNDCVSERRLGSPGDNPGADKQHRELGRLEVKDPQRKTHQLAARGKICKKKVGF